VLLFRDAGGTIFGYRPRVLWKISGGKGFILMQLISFAYGEMNMFRFGSWVLVIAVLSASLWGQGSTQGSPAQGSSTPAASAPADSGKKSTSGKHHHKHHHHHKKQAGATQ
jgi:ABC-type nickel/cobalt efflux system permease component RcnA